MVFIHTRYVKIDLSKMIGGLFGPYPNLVILNQNLWFEKPKILVVLPF
jgi:hypothetical protein